MRLRHPALPTVDDVAFGSGYAIASALVGPAVLVNVLAWSTGSLTPKPPQFWFSALSSGLLGGLMALWLRRSPRVRRGFGALLVLGIVPAAFALLVLLRQT